MLVTPPISRMLTKAGTLVVLSLLVLPAPSAMAASRRSPGKFCDAKTTSIGRLIRQARAVGGPLAKRLRHAGIRLNGQTTWLQLTPPGDVHDEDQAIQNDAPAAPQAVDLEID